MNRVSIMALVGIALLATPAFGAAHYYVVQDMHSYKCSVTSKKPAAGTMSVIGSAHTSMKAAEKAMKADAACK